MNINVRIWITTLVSMLALTSFTAMAMTPQQKKMQDQLNQLDQLDQLDHLEFVEQNDKANACTRARNFDCAEKKIAEAAKSAGNSQDKNTLRLAQQNLAAERQTVANEEAAEKRRLRAEELRREEEKRQRIAQQEREQERREHDTNMRGLVAIVGAAAIGQSMKGYSEAQRSDVVDAYVKDVANDTGGSNLNAATNKVLAQRTNEHNSQMRALAEQRQTNAVAAEAAENERLMKAAYESRHPNGGYQQAGKQQQADNAKLAVAPRNAENSRAAENQAATMRISSAGREQTADLQGADFDALGSQLPKTERYGYSCGRWSGEEMMARESTNNCIAELKRYMTIQCFPGAPMNEYNITRLKCAASKSRGTAQTAYRDQLNGAQSLIRQYSPECSPEAGCRGNANLGNN